MVTNIEAAAVKLDIETIDCLVRLKSDSKNNVILYKKIEELQSKIVDDVSKNLHIK